MAAATPALAALERAGVAHSVHTYEHDPGTRAEGWGAEAVAALGVPAERVLKTLVVAADDRLVLVVLSVAATLDLKALGRELSTKRVALAEPRVAEAATGGVVGAISALGTRRRLATVVDAAALGHPTVFCSAGRRGLEVELAPAALVQVAGARTAPVARFPADPAAAG